MRLICYGDDGWETDWFSFDDGMIADFYSCFNSLMSEILSFIE